MKNIKLYVYIILISVCSCFSCSTTPQTSESISNELKGMLKKAFCYPELYNTFGNNYVSTTGIIPHFYEGTVLLRDKEGNLIHINEDGEIVNTMHDSIEVVKYLVQLNFPESYYPYKENGNWGFKDINDTIKIKAEYDKVYIDYRYNSYVVRYPNSDNYWVNGGTIIDNNYNIKGKYLIHKPISKEDKSYAGVIDMANNKQVVGSSRFIDINYENGYFIVQHWLEEKYGLYNKKGEEILPFEYDKIRCENIGMYDWFELKKDNKYQFAVSYYDGGISFSPQYEAVGTRVSQYVTVCKNGKWGLLKNVNGYFEEEIPCIWNDQLLPLTDNVFAYYKDFNSGYALIDKNQDYLTNHQYSEVYSEYDYIVVKDNSTQKKGMLDRYGREIVPLKYDFLSIRNRNLLEVTYNDNCGLITIDEEELIPCSYNEIQYYPKQIGENIVYALAKANNKSHIYHINNSSAVITDYSDIETFKFYGLRIYVLMNDDYFKIRITNESNDNNVIFDGEPFNMKDKNMQQYLVDICSIIANHLLNCKNPINLNDYILGNHDSNIPMFLYNDKAFNYTFNLNDYY